MGIEIDLTREQFSSEEIVTGGVVVPRKPVTSWRRLRAEYEILRSRVEVHLDVRPGESESSRLNPFGLLGEPRA